MSLNVISALTRLGVDPWEEATRLADLPKAVAAEALARLVARSPIDRPQPSDNRPSASNWSSFYRDAEIRVRRGESRLARRRRNILTL